jgi:hypothetical protein
MKRKHCGYLHLEWLETRNLLSHGLGAQVTPGFGLPDPAASLNSSATILDNNTSDSSPAAQAIVNSPVGGHGNQGGNNLEEADSLLTLSPSVKQAEESNSGTDSGQNSGNQKDQSRSAEDQAVVDSSGSEQGNHQGDSQAEKNDQAESDVTQHMAEQKDNSFNAEVKNQASESDKENLSPGDGNSQDGSGKGQVNHSKNDNDSGNAPDRSKVKGKNDIDDSSSNNSFKQTEAVANSQDGSSRGDGGSNSGDQNSSRTSGQFGGQSGNSDDDGSGEIRAPTSAAEGQPSVAGNVADNHGKLRTEVAEPVMAEASSVRPAGSVHANFALFDAELLVASLASQSIQRGADSSLPDVSRFANLADQMLHSGVEALASPLGAVGMDAMKPLSVGAYDLLLGFLPVDQESLDQAMQGFMNGLGNLSDQLTDPETATWVYPAIVAAALAVGYVASRRRRKSPNRQIWTVDRGSWMGTWFPSLSTFQK